MAAIAACIWGTVGLAGSVGIVTKPEGAGEGPGLGLGDGLGLGEGLALGLGLGLGEAEGEGLALGLGEGVGVGVEEEPLLPPPPPPPPPPAAEQTFWLGETKTVCVPTLVGAVKVKVDSVAPQVAVKPPLLFKVMRSAEVKVMEEPPPPSFSRTTVTAVESTVIELTAELGLTVNVLSYPDK